MPILIPKKPTTPPIDCDAVEERIRLGAWRSISNEEMQALGQRDKIRNADLINREAAAAMLGITVRTLYNWHRQNFGPKRQGGPGHYRYSRAEVAAWLADHGKGFRQSRCDAKDASSDHVQRQQQEVETTIL